VPDALARWIFDGPHRFPQAARAKAYRMLECARRSPSGSVTV